MTLCFLCKLRSASSQESKTNISTDGNLTGEMASVSRDPTNTPTPTVVGIDNCTQTPVALNSGDCVVGSTGEE